MINQEKVCDMTKMAAYEDGKGEKELNISTFRRKDFVALEMVKSFFLGSVSYVILLVIYVLVKPEFIAKLNTFAAMKEYGIKIGIAYIIFLGAYFVLTFFWARARHKAAVADSASYRRKLRRVSKTYRDHN